MPKPTYIEVPYLVKAAPCRNSGDIFFASPFTIKVPFRFLGLC